MVRGVVERMPPSMPKPPTEISPAAPEIASAKPTGTPPASMTNRNRTIQNADIFFSSPRTRGSQPARDP